MLCSSVPSSVVQLQVTQSLLEQTLDILQQQQQEQQGKNATKAAASWGVSMRHLGGSLSSKLLAVHTASLYTCEQQS